MLKNLVLSVLLGAPLTTWAAGDHDPFEDDSSSDHKATMMNDVQGMIIRVPVNANGDAVGDVEMRASKNSNVSENNISGVFDSSTSMSSVPQLNTSSDDFSNDSSTWGMSSWGHHRGGHHGGGWGGSSYYNSYNYYNNYYYNNYRPTYYYGGSSWGFSNPYSYYGSSYGNSHCNGYRYYYYPRGW